MRLRKKFSTSTITPTNDVVPWLAASGPLAYTPEAPPARDYYFQYGWILPEIFADDTDIKRHRFFGLMGKEDARNVYAFWQNARAGKVDQVFKKTGAITPLTVSAPIAVYRHQLYGRGDPGLMFIQHGSYQHIHSKDQPEIEKGIVYLYRGIGDSTEFNWLKFDVTALKNKNKEAWLAFVKTQGQVLSDSVLSFNSIHDRAVRSETKIIRDRSHMSNDLAKKNDLDVDSDGFPGLLWETHHQCFGMEHWVAERKFGPNYVVCKTPVTNIRITTWFAGECEAKVLDPNRVEFVGAVGCKVKEVSE
ncbi:MAG TPA: hypothetical protein DCS07_04850 [Bdellovibrionales bacterium]|nr:MAG: hypothetical protein A2X97_12080 [Bdellovibrionales bacterium GWA1_52_35]HAR41948.1 hypothetical protein [Bdellovibrionales bacterium]